jgi:hypothetical protein
VILQGKTIVSAAEALDSNAAKAALSDTAQQRALHPPTPGEVTPNTDANNARKMATDPKPTTPKHTSPNQTLQSYGPSTNAWPVSPGQSQVSQSTGRGKWVIAALLLIVVGAFLAFRGNRNTNPESNETKHTNPLAVEPNNGQMPTDAGGAKASSTSPEVQYQAPSSTVQSQPVTQQQDSNSKVGEEKPVASEPLSTQKPEQTEAKREPEKEGKREPEKTETSQSQPAFRPNDQPREEERRPPPHLQPPPHGGPPPPPPGGGPPPDRRRP